MFGYIIRRLFIMIPTLLVISLLVFLIIQAPPGDYLSNIIAECQSRGEMGCENRIRLLREEFHLDRPFLEQYAYWAVGLLQGDLGYSFEYQLPVRDVVGDRLWLTIIVTFKYLFLLSRADNQGEGGIFALYALLRHAKAGLSKRAVVLLSMMALLGASLLYGDGIITPAISVLAAVEGLHQIPQARHFLEHQQWFIPATAALLARSGGLRGWKGVLGVAAHAASIAGLARIHRDAGAAAGLLETALVDELGADYRSRIHEPFSPQPEVPPRFA